ncbi:MAG: dephospho-CoA kinase [Candidatus Eisenbacteria sp.]|nr:dephospho-CoA kinase [Candidatus Eisenbacteria bacterium]
MVVGITGGIASGKTTIAKELEKLGAVLVDADQIGHDVVDNVAEVRDRLREAFGDSIFDAQDRIDRSRLGERVFGDGDALGRLNAIVHPHLLEELRSRVEHLASGPGGKVIVIDAALLVEWKAQEWLDYLVVVESGAERQLERICSRDGLTREEARGRISSQVGADERAAVADEIIGNDAGLDDLARAAHDLWLRLEAIRK